MSYAITISDVLAEGFSTRASTLELTGFIATVDEADTCLSGANVPAYVGQAMKVLAVRHLASLADGSAQVVSETAASGASRSYARKERGGSPYLDTLKQMDTHGCLTRLLHGAGGASLMASGRMSGSIR